MENAQDQVAITASEAHRFLSSLEHTFTEGLPQKKLATVRQCVQRIKVNKSENLVQMQPRVVPVASLLSVDRLTININSTSSEFIKHNCSDYGL